MAFEIRKVRPEKINLNLLVYGKPGVGKTTFAAQAGDHPDMAPALVLNLEGGLLSVAGRGDIDEIRISRIADLEEVVSALYAGDKNLKKYKTIIIDSGSELAKMSLAEKVRLGMDRSQNKTLDDIEVQNYGQSQAQMRRIFAALRDLPVHTIMTSLERVKYRQGTNADNARPIGIGPDFSGGLSQAVIGMFDAVWYFYIVKESGIRAMQTQPHGVIEAKTRGPNFAEAIGLYVTEPSLDELYATLLATEAGIGEIPERFIPTDESEEGNDDEGDSHE